MKDIIITILTLIVIFLISCIVFLIRVVNDKTSVILTYPAYSQYDVNRDGKVNAVDYVAIKKYILERK